MCKTAKIWDTRTLYQKTNMQNKQCIWYVTHTYTGNVLVAHWLTGT